MMKITMQGKIKLSITKLKIYKKSHYINMAGLGEVITLIQFAYAI